MEGREVEIGTALADRSAGGAVRRAGLLSYGMPQNEVGIKCYATELCQEEFQKPVPSCNGNGIAGPASGIHTIALDAPAPCGIPGGNV